MQKTAYEISACLVGSEMCIRDRFGVEVKNPADLVVGAAPKNALWEKRRDAAVGEVERSEAVHIFGTDKMGTADLFRLFMGKLSLIHI